ncbi:hypothetical protein PFLUV_G00131080 [Xyrichtys novacula]|uniref:Uncharacterized protein n=1 Tax=Xyrichtys novacula TaxID=13765 RepID=A0AAV1GBT0_XYRNO|nr:hypothetical protein PFLUV_G00131080 [Xyrichtys novacula]
MASSPRLAHPPRRHCGRVGPCGLPGPQLRLASIWPDRENTSQFQNKSNNGWTEEDEQDLVGDRTPTKGDKLGRLASLYPDSNPSRCWINKTRVKQADRRSIGFQEERRILSFSVSVVELAFVKGLHFTLWAENLGEKQSLTGKG